MPAKNRYATAAPVGQIVGTSSNRLSIRITCDPDMTQAVIVVGDGPCAISIGIPADNISRLIEEASIVKLILEEHGRTVQ